MKTYENLPKTEQDDGIDISSFQEELIRPRRSFFLAAIALLLFAFGGISYLRHKSNAQQHLQKSARLDKSSLDPHAAARGKPADKALQSQSTIQLKPMQVRLAGSSKQKVHITLALGHDGHPQLAKELVKRDIQIQQTVAFVLQKKPAQYYSNPDTRQKLQGELKLAINQVMKRKVIDVKIIDLQVH